MKTQLFYCSTLFGAMTLAAAIDAGLFGPAGRRVLLVSSNVAVPELISPLHRTPAFEAIGDRFDHVHFWNELIAPYHPVRVRVRPEQGPLLRRLLTQRLLDGHAPDELVVESIGAYPARGLVEIFSGCPITVYSEGLMSYGPTRDAIPGDLGARVERLLYLDLIEGMRPLMLAEHKVPAVAVPDVAFRDIVGKVSAVTPVGGRGGALLLSQYMSDAGLISWDEEQAIHEAMLHGVAARGFTTVRFKPHPSAGRRQVRGMQALADELGVQLTVVPESVPAETCFAAYRPDLVVGTFSTGLITARHYFGIPVATVGCPRVLERMKPYENSNRVAVTIVDASVPELTRTGALVPAPVEPDLLPRLVEGVVYCAQRKRMPHLRASAEAAVRELRKDVRWRYFPRRRLTQYGLIKKAPRPSLWRRALRYARRLVTG